MPYHHEKWLKILAHEQVTFLEFLFDWTKKIVNSLLTGNFLAISFFISQSLHIANFFTVLDQHNVSELLSLSVLFQMVKLKSYCCEYLSRNLNSKNVHTAVDLSFRHCLNDLQRRSFSFLQRSFGYLYDHDREELIQYGPQLVQGILFLQVFTFRS